MENLVAIAAFVLSIISLVWHTFTWRKQQRQSRSAANLGLLAETKLKLGEIPEAFRFHGISKDEMEEHGISEQELSYLVANFMAGQIFYETEDNNFKTPFPEGDYRDQMCKTPSLQKAWPLVSRLLDDSPYRKRLEITINKYGTSN